MKIATLLSTVLLTAAFALGAATQDILGIWKTEHGEAQVEIFKCGENLCGRIVWLKESFYTDGRYGQHGAPLRDINNPNPAIRNRPIIGLQIMEGFRPIGENKWGNGTIYDPKSGNTYRGKIHLVSPQRMELHGYVGIPLFGRTAVWTR